jgi:ketosteroid isomerase-like protein
MGPATSDIDAERTIELGRRVCHLSPAQATLFSEEPIPTMRNRIVVALLMLAAAGAGYLVGARDERQTLLQTDRNFDAATAKGGAPAWASFFAGEGVMMPAGGDPVIGRDKIEKAMSGAFSTPGFSLRWEPVDGATSGDLGYTRGTYQSTRIDTEGKPVPSYGKYVTIWRRERGGEWKAIVDIGNASPAPQNQQR